MQDLDYLAPHQTNKYHGCVYKQLDIEETVKTFLGGPRVFSIPCGYSITGDLYFLFYSTKGDANLLDESVLLQIDSDLRMHANGRIVQESGLDSYFDTSGWEYWFSDRVDHIVQISTGVWMYVIRSVSEEFRAIYVGSEQDYRLLSDSIFLVHTTPSGIWVSELGFVQFQPYATLGYMSGDRIEFPSTMIRMDRLDLPLSLMWVVGSPTETTVFVVAIDKSEITIATPTLLVIVSQVGNDPMSMLGAQTTNGTLLVSVPVQGAMCYPGTKRVRLGLIVTDLAVWISACITPDWVEPVHTRVIRLDRTDYSEDPVVLEGASLDGLLLVVHPSNPLNLLIVLQSTEGWSIVYGPINKYLVEGTTCVSDGMGSIRWNRVDGGPVFAHLRYGHDLLQHRSYEFLLYDSVTTIGHEIIDAGEIYMIRNDGQSDFALGTFGGSSFSCRPFEPYTIQDRPLNRNNIEELLQTGKRMVTYCTKYGATANDRERCLCLDTKRMISETFGNTADKIISEGSIVSTAGCFHEGCSKRIMDRGVPVYSTYSAYLSLIKCSSRVTVCIPSLEAEGIFGSAVSLINNCGDGDTGDINTIVDGFPVWAKGLLGAIVVVIGLSLMVVFYRWYARRRQKV